MGVFIVIPAYNEGEVLRSTVQSLLHHGYSIVIVDDGSARPANQWIRGIPVHSLRHPVNLGQGAALQTGTTYALSKGADIVVHFDADGQHPAEQIPVLIQPILDGECDVVLGSRFLQARDRRLVPLRKRLLLRLGILVSGLLTRVWLTDAHNGFRALSREAARRVHFEENGFSHATELLEHLREQRLRYREVPSTIRYTEYSLRKGQSIFNSVNIVLDLLLRKLIK